MTTATLTITNPADELWLAPATPAGIRLLLAALDRPCPACGSPAGIRCVRGCGETA
jgi:hypothetical protein